MRPIYSEGVKYEFRYAYSVSESMRLKSEDSRKENSNAGFDMNVSVAVVQNEIDDGGNLKMMVGFEPADDSLLDESDSEETQDTLMFYQVELDESYKIVSITGAQEAMKEENLRYLLSFLEQLTPHVRNQSSLEEQPPRNLRELMDQAELDDMIKSNGEVNSRGVEIPLQAHNVDLTGRDVYTITASNDNLIYPSAAMQPKPGFPAPKYYSFEKVTIDQDRTLVEDEKSVEIIIGQQDDEEEDPGRNLGQDEDNITLKARIYQVTKAEGNLKLIRLEEMKDQELEQTKKTLANQDTKTVKRQYIENLLLYPESEPTSGNRNLVQKPRNLLSQEEIQIRVTGHYPSDFTGTSDNIYIYKKDIINLKILGNPVKGGVYAAAGYSYQFEAEKFGGFASAGAGAYVSSTVYTDDWYYFLTGGTTARFQGDKIIFEIGQLKNGEYTQLSYSKTLDNPWPELSGIIVTIFSKETTLLQKLKELILEIKDQTPGVSHLQVPAQFEEFGDQCTDLRSMADKFLSDDDNLHLTQCLDLIKSGIENVIEQIDIFIRDSNAPQVLIDMAQEAKALAEQILPIIESMRNGVSAFEGEVKDIFKAISLPLEQSISHLDDEKTLFYTCWPVWIISVCVEAKSKQVAQSTASVNVMQLNAQAGPKYEATIQVDGYISVYIARAGVRVIGMIASAELANQVKQKDNTNLAQTFEVDINSCLASNLNVRAIQADIYIYYSYKTLSFSCRNWRCSFRTKWKDKTLVNWPLLKENTKQFQLINTC